MTLDDLLDEGGAALLTRLRTTYAETHHCAGCIGSDRNDVGPFCEACGYLLDLHDRASECPDETEARGRWGR